MASCSLCGGTNFFLEAGFYFCTECQTQVQDDQEEVTDYFTGAQGMESRIVKEKSSKKLIKKSFDEELTTWEMYNIILRGFVDEMIALGATKDLKIVVLQLWAAYLSQLEVAFHGNKEMKLDICYKKRDIELLSGKKFDVFTGNSRVLNILKVRSNSKKMKKEKEQKKKKNRKLPTQLTRLKRKLIEAEVSKLNSLDKNFIESSQLQSQSQTLENLTMKDAADGAFMNRFSVTSRVKCFTKALDSHSELSPSQRKKLIKSKMTCDKQSVHNLTLSKLIGILQLGMALSHQKAQIGDTIRWIAEGHLSRDNCRKFFSPDIKIPFLRGIIFDQKISHSSIRLNLNMIAGILSVKLIPAPNFFQLTARYCLELQLPDELLQMVHALLELHPPKENFSKNTSCEARAMSYIIVTLKLFFGLDGVTERTFSDMADFANRKLATVEGKNERYFSWTEWVKFIECRKTVVSHFHYPTRLALLRDNHSAGDSFAFVSYWRKRQESDHQKSKTADKLFGDKMENTLEYLSELNTYNDLDFPASLTPMVTYSNELLNNYSAKLHPATCTILRKSFASHFLLSPDRLNKLKNYIKIVELWSSLRSMKKISRVSPFLVPVSFKTTPVDILMIKETQLLNKSIKRKRSQLDESLLKITDGLLKKRLIEVQGKLKENVNGTSNHETSSSDDNTFSIVKPFEYYWYLHGTFYECCRPARGEEFDNICRKLFSSSFLWLLKECSRVICQIPRELYYEVVQTELSLR